jgi:TorA maturation chaperone TorD
MVESASLRAKSYSFLASIYLKAATNELISAFLRERPLSTESQGMKNLSEFLSENRLKSVEQLEEVLATEHLRLFGGVTQGYGPPPPYESVWRGEGRVMGATTADVLRAYANAGLEPATQTTEPPDHVGYELGYLSHLCGKEADSRRSGDTVGTAKYLQMEHEFLRDHLEKWVPDFCQKIAENDRTGFYKAIALLTKEFLLTDAEAIGEQSTTWNQQSP